MLGLRIHSLPSRVLIAQGSHFQRLVHHGHQVIERKRLQEEVHRARLHRLHGGLDGAERGHDDDRGRHVLPAHAIEQLQTVHPGQAQVGEHQVGALSELDAFLGRGGLVHLETGAGELQLDYPAQLFLVLDDQYAGLHCIGRKTRKILPFPGSLSTAILPPCSSTIFETMASPSPTPSGLVVKKGLKIASSRAGSMPAPRSITSVSAMPSTTRVLTVIAPPSAVVWAALSSRL